MPLTFSEETEIISLIADMETADLYKILYLIEKDSCPKTVTKTETIFDLKKLSDRTIEKLRKTLLSE